MENPLGVTHGNFRHHCHTGGGMAYFYRLIVLFFSVVSFPAFASFPATDVTPSGVCTAAPCTGWHGRNPGWTASPTKDAAAVQVCTYYHGAPVSPYPQYVANLYGYAGPGYLCSSSVAETEFYSVAIDPVPRSYSCPAMSTLSGSTCTCTAPAVQGSGSCALPVDPNIAKCAALGGKSGGEIVAPYTGTNLGGPTYTNLCGQDSDDSHCAMTVRYSMGIGGQKYGDATYTGGRCTPDPTSDGSSAGSTPSLTPPPALGDPVPPGASTPTCPRGSAAEEINGIMMCTPLDLSKKEVETVGKTTDVAADGAKSESTESTTCKAGQCSTTTTTTTTPPGGGASTTTTTTKDQPQQDFCTQNPRSPACVTSSFSGGSCGAVMSCDGDAVQCAIAAQAKKTACAFESSAAATTEENAYTAARAVTGDQTTGSGINSTVNVSAASFDQTNLLGAETGLSDLTVTVMGRATTLPLSGLNTWFDVLGKLLMGVTAILCMRIVARG